MLACQREIQSRFGKGNLEAFLGVPGFATRSSAQVMKIPCAQCWPSWPYRHDGGERLWTAATEPNDSDDANAKWPYNEKTVTAVTDVESLAH